MLFAGCLSAAPAGSQERVAVGYLLRELIASGVDVLFSSELVPSTLDAPDVLPQADVMVRVVAALAGNHLLLRRVGARSYVVSRAPAPAANAPSAVAAGQGLASRALTLEEISVLANRDAIPADTPGEPIGFDRHDIERLPGAQADAFRALRAAPGLATNLSARPYVRGGLLDDVLVEFDGMPLADPFHFKTFQSVISAFDPSTVERADVFTGGFPVKFGTRSGGVLDLTPRSIGSGYEFGAGASLLSYDLQGVGRGEKVPIEWLLSARISREHSVIQPLVGETGEPKFSDALGRVRWRPGEDSAFTLGVLALDDRLDVRSEYNDEHARGTSRDLDTWLKWDWTPTGAVQGHSSLGFANTERTSDANLDLPGIAVGRFYEDRFFSTYSLRSEWVYAPSAALTWDFGTEFGRERAQLMFSRDESFSGLIASSFGRPLAGPMNSNQYPRYSSGALYASAHRQWPSLDAEVGVRVDAQAYDGVGAKAQLSPRVNVRYDFRDGWRVYGSWGQFSQAQRVDEYRSEVKQVAPDGASHATHLVAGIGREVATDAAWRVEAYRNHWSAISPYFDSLLGSVSVSPELEPGRVLIAPTDAESSGIEASAHRSLGHGLRLWGTYSLSRTTDDIAGRDVARSWDQTHAANLGVTWARRQTAASVIVGWHTGWPRTPLTVSSAAAGAPASLIVGTRNSARWRNYLTADFRVSTAFTLRYGELSLWADAVNVTNRANECCTDLDSMASPPGAFALITESWSPRMLNLGFVWRIRGPRR